MSYNKNNAITLSKSFVFSLIILGLLSCASAPQQQPPPPNSKAAKLILHGIPDNSYVADLRMDNGGKFLKVQAIVRNESSHVDQIYYRFRWYNKNGMETGAEEGWKTIPILDGDQQTLIGIATTKDAVDFRLELQSPNNSH